MGGLGNQMFQFSCGRALSLRFEQEFYVAQDLFQKYPLHNGYELQDAFDLKTKIVSKKNLKDLLGWQAPTLMRKFLGRRKMDWAVNKNWINEPQHSYWNGINNLNFPIYLHGYWQSEKYFNDITDVIRNDFSFATTLSDLDLEVLEKIKIHTAVSVHVRRGDYTIGKNTKVFAQTDIEYYHRAINFLSRQNSNLKFFIFSDDPDWVKQNLIIDSELIEIVSHNLGKNSANDMRLMSNCEHHIISNSSFSWWGAWLNPSSRKIVIAPKKWFLNDTDAVDIVPSKWLMM